MMRLRLVLAERSSAKALELLYRLGRSVSLKHSQSGKKLIAICALFLLLLSGSNLTAQNNTTRFFYAFAHEEITVATSAIGFTAATYKPAGVISAQLATFTVTCASGSTCPINMLADTNTPTSSVGQSVDTGGFVTIYGQENIVNFLAIRSTSVSATIHVVYSR